MERLENRLSTTNTQGIQIIGIAHELNNPISAWNYSFELIRDLILESDDPFIKNQIVKYCENGLLALKQSLSIISAMHNSYHKEEWHEINLHNEINTQLILLESKYKHRINIHKKYELESCEIYVYGSEIGQAILCVLNNAIQAIQNNGIIKIKTGKTTLEDDLDYVFVEINDSGEGIQNKDVTNIFDLYYTTKKDGTGQGLAISKTNIENRYGGRLFLKDTKLGIGSTFRFEIPIEQIENIS